MNSLTNLSDLTTAITSSSDHPVFLFKHSTSCPISAFADDAYRTFARDHEGALMEFTHLDLLAHREVSNAIAETTGIKHESPQAILLVDGRPVWSASHTGITPARMAEAVAQYCG